jgi:hypothetical protein
VEVDLFANMCNRKREVYMTLQKEDGAKGYDAFSVNWNGLSPFIHPPIPLILRCLRKVEDETVKGVILLPLWRGQSWSTLLARMTVRRTFLGKAQEILTPGKWMRKTGSQLPPGDMEMYLIQGGMRKDGIYGEES